MSQTISWQRRYDVWCEFNNSDKSKAELGREFDMSPRSVGRSIEMIDEKTIPELKELGVKIIESNHDGTYVELGEEVEATLAADIENATVIDEEPQFIITGQSVMMVIGGEPKTMESSHPCYVEICNALMEGRYSDAVRAINIPKSITELSHGKITVKNGRMLYDGYDVDHTMSRYVVHNLSQGITPTNVLNFVENMMQNPSYRAVNELYGFIKACSLPITEDGYFLAYKKVREDYTDCYTGTIDNSVGAEPKMRRNMVDDNKHNTCSDGYHFCSESYLNHFGGERVMVLKINPADVVSIPIDYNNAKGRCCKYKVVAELKPGEKIADFYSDLEV